ncbi:MAG: ABC transporter permease, partial [Chloroflexota bacterium]
MGRLDRWIEAVSRWLNPILIKESRQSLKSNQFLVTFSLVLAAALFWSFFALAVTPNITQSSNSLILLSGYFW